jgi:hypothetical protein
MPPKSCPPHKIVNPKTGKCVLKTGAIGKKLVPGLHEPLPSVSIVKPMDMTPSKLLFLNQIIEFYQIKDSNYVYLADRIGNMLYFGREDVYVNDLLQTLEIKDKEMRGIASDEALADFINKIVIPKINRKLKESITSKSLKLTLNPMNTIIISKKPYICYEDVLYADAILEAGDNAVSFTLLSETDELITLTF